MKYLCLVYLDAANEQTRSAGGCAALAGADRDYQEDLRRAGQAIVAAALQPPHRATAVRFLNGEPCLSDGPDGATTAALAAFYLIEARDLNEAIRIVSRIPSARHGSVEVRPVVECEPRDQAGADEEEELRG